MSVEPESLKGVGRVKFEAVSELRAREIAREEIASLCGLVLRRLQGAREEMAELDKAFDELDIVLTADDREALVRNDLSKIFGEALRDFSQTPDEPGPEEAA